MHSSPQKKEFSTTGHLDHLIGIFDTVNGFSFVKKCEQLAGYVKKFLPAISDSSVLLRILSAHLHCSIAWLSEQTGSLGTD